MYGFYVTNKGEELIAKTLQGEKITITKACFGSGGNHNEPFNYGIEELVDQFYEKELNLDTDLAYIDPTSPNQINIITEIPVNVSGTINEIGYKDASDNLILYGLVEEQTKESEKHQIFHYENYIRLEQKELDTIEFTVTSTEYNQLLKMINELKSLINSITGGDLDARITALEDQSETTNTSIESLEASVTELESLEERVQALEDTVGNAVERLNGAL